MTIELEFPEGATPLDPDETQDLIPSYISTQGELNAAEQANILKARQWAMSKKGRDVLDDQFLRELHKRMFGDVWRWAGAYRKSGKNIGVSSPQISSEVRSLIEDARFWISNATFTWDELGSRFHHRLVSIHPFSNGNGRHARLMTDLLLLSHDQAVFTWGALKDSQSIGSNGSVRDDYIKALRAADRNQFDLLIQFVRS
ncbi:MAG: mobile mystery protein B [Bdellovibrionia bacterium]